MHFRNATAFYLRTAIAFSSVASDAAASVHRNRIVQLHRHSKLLIGGLVCNGDLWVVISKVPILGPLDFRQRWLRFALHGLTLDHDL